ncbi:uncharacterized protein F5Z01DRAFT_433887 [Emericellopsis atlantica]|uniref:Methyltransferase n=1 Tax=Emericellopsis atlantica TaxID=2614577 RepID=A0A9P7ZD75_9HYPO|nr:uncharacterized protein F5Z01DRAFT_433887 [Emericellopsis atlantica]KAG9249983.1 hypothetical protein F5Z01DRAFT_433887 [Emericellopsis atlantica]
MIGAITYWQGLAQKAIQNLEPGGYFEIQDYLYPLFGNRDDGKWRRPTYTNGRSIWWRRRSMLPHGSRKYSKMQASSPSEETRHVPIGGWPRDPTLKWTGRIVGGMLTDNLGGTSSALFTRHLRWTEEKMRVYLARVRKELQDHDIEALSRVYAVWGRKLLDAGL